MMPAQKRKVCEHFMKRTKKELCLKLEVPPDTAEKCILAAMAPMSAMATGRRSILLTSRQMSAAAVLDTLTMLKSAQETLLFYIVRPSNLGVLPANAIYARIEALKNVLSTQANIELLALNSRESFTQNRAFYHDRLQQETNPEIRRLLEQDRQHLDEMQVEMKLAREFYLVVRLKNEKRETVYSLLSTIEESLHKSGLPVRRAGREDLKRILALYFEENTTSERMEDYDGQRFLEG